jgi:1-aminocyclopropane-1-carboxylate deaminase/D-cysteine desulfhydrase-like pyridoxal-dependent ACC family enzyme
MSEEIKPQLEKLGVKPNYIISPCATSSTMTGISLGNKVSGLNATVIGVALSRSVEDGKEMLTEEFNADAKTMGFPYSIRQDEVRILGEYIGEGYAIRPNRGWKPSSCWPKQRASFSTRPIPAKPCPPISTWCEKAFSRG